MDQIPFADIDLIENPEPRCPCVLLLDVSGSMAGEPVERMTEGLCLLRDELNNEALARKRVELAVVTFADDVVIEEEFQTPEKFEVPHLSTGGGTRMGKAVVKACEMLDERKKRYREKGIGYFRPWLFLITDGAPTDYDSERWKHAVGLVREGETTKKLLFFGIAVADADLSRLTELCPANRPPQKLKGLSFRELFTWLSTSLRTASSARPGATLQLPPASGWIEVEV